MTDAPKSGRKNLIINAVLVALAFGLLGWTVWKNSSKLKDVWARQPDMRLLVLALGVYILALVITFARWHRLVTALDLPFRFRDAIRLGFIGNVFNLVIPGAVGGDVIKAAFLCKEQEKKTQAVASMVIDRALGLLGLFVLASIFGAYAWSGAEPDVRKVILVAWILVACGVLGLAILFSPSLYRPLMKLLPPEGKLAKTFGELVTMASVYRQRLGVVGSCLGLAVVGHGLFVICFYVIDHALFGSAAPPLVSHFVVVPLILLSMAIPIPFGALGVSEQFAETLFREVLDFHGGAVVMLGYRAIMYSAGLVSVLVYLANARQVRSLRQAEAVQTAS